MEDLRRDYNVKTNRNLNTNVWWNRHRKNIINFPLSICCLFILVYPNKVGEWIGNWTNQLVLSFIDESSITTHQWGVILVTLLVFSICYKIITSRKKQE